METIISSDKSKKIDSHDLMIDTPTFDLAEMKLITSLINYKLESLNYVFRTEPYLKFSSI